MNKDLMFSSETDDWATPTDFFEAVNRIFGFTLDVCASESNRKCDKYFDAQADGLAQQWEGICWMNPPYGRTISKWVEKAYQTGKEGSTVVCLLPARTDTRWWHDYCTKGEILFLKGRLKFGSAKSAAPFPSALVVFRPKLEDLTSERG